MGISDVAVENLVSPEILQIPFVAEDADLPVVSEELASEVGADKS
jgi:hypothetical protein